MAEENLLDTLIKKVDGLITDVRTNSFALDKLGHAFETIGSRFDSIDEQFAIQREQGRLLGVKIDSLASKVIEIDKQLAIVEAQLNLFERKIGGLSEEAEQIRLELNDLNEQSAGMGEAEKRIGLLEVRLFQLEEKLST